MFEGIHFKFYKSYEPALTKEGIIYFLNWLRFLLEEVGL